jgi:hypothetical protein
MPIERKKMENIVFGHDADEFGKEMMAAVQRVDDFVNPYMPPTRRPVKP